MKNLECIDNIQYHLYTISNDDFEISVSDYGATLFNYKYHDIDIVRGFDNVDGYINDVKYMNATIGRVCNRIKDGHFVLNGTDYYLYQNNAGNCLHGGKEGFDTKKWDVSVNDNQIICTYLSKDMEEGFSGNLQVKVVYTLLANGLQFAYEATSDKDTLCNICNHAFFNINGCDSKTVLNDHLMINANKIGMIDSDGCTLNDTLDVDNTPFDFRKRKLIGKDIDSDHIQILNAHGYDHHFIIDGEGFRKFGTYDNGKLALDIYSDLDGMHVYSGNFLDGTSNGKNGNNYPFRSSICFETQYYPNAINTTDHVKPILRKNEVFRHVTRYLVREIKDED